MSRAEIGMDMSPINTAMSIRGVAANSTTSITDLVCGNLGFRGGGGPRWVEGICKGSTADAAKFRETSKHET